MVQRKNNQRSFYYFTQNVPIFWLRFIPALCGSLLSPCVYKLLLQMKLNRWTSALGGCLIILDNALLTQSRFILVESMLLTFSLSALLFLLKFQESQTYGMAWIANGILAATFCAFAFCVKFVGFYTGCLCFVTSCRYLWKLLPNKSVTNVQLWLETMVRCLIFIIVPISVYLLVFYVHLSVLYKAGPHDSIMTSAFQVKSLNIFEVCIINYIFLGFAWRWFSIDNKRATAKSCAWFTNYIKTYTGSNVLVAFTYTCLSGTISG